MKGFFLNKFLNPVGGRGGINWSSYCTPQTEIAKVTFADAMTNTTLRARIKSIRYYGADKTHTYIMRFVSWTTTRIQIYIRDTFDNSDISYDQTVSIDYATFPTFFKLKNPSTGKSEKYAIVEVDFGGANYASGALTTVEQCGVSPSALFDYTDVADYISEHVYHELITVGAGQDYETLRAAVESTYHAGTEQCMRACYHHQIMIRLTAGTFVATNLTLPEYVMIEGRGSTKTIIETEDATQQANLNAVREHKMFGLTIKSLTGDGGAWAGNYCIHSDDNNINSGTGERRIVKYYRDVNLVGGINNKTWLYGCGISSGEKIKFVNCYGGHLNPTYAAVYGCFGFHPTAASALKAEIFMEGCRSTNTNGVFLNATPDSGQVNDVTLTSCDFVNVSENGEQWNVVEN